MRSEPVSVAPVAVDPKAVDATSKAASTDPTSNEPSTAPESLPAPDAPKSPAADSVSPPSNTLTTPEKSSKTETSTPEKKTVDFVEVKGAMENMLNELPSLIKDTEQSEMWGVELTADINHVPTTIVLEKFLRANNKNVAEAIVQLKKALKWRKEMNPRKLLTDVEFDTSRFGDLGYVTVYSQPEGKVKEIVTWNIYGAVKDKKATFGDVEEFIKWRAALMELSVQELDLKSATEKIPEDGVDPYRMVQVHDYLNVSFLRMDPSVKAASKKTIETFSMAYPELLKEKFFVNVPLVMGWVFAGMKLFLSAETVKKFHPLSYGSNLAAELPDFGQDLPVAYGGKGKDIKEGLTVRYAPADADVKATED
ncbi:putative Phosphatidylinositol transfer protein sfh5 [Glarea lozoyensis 74030]|nr:putative Phosphatidylinositol transfer protein sfh5 [Glarea lozoyensis 74030]